MTATAALLAACCLSRRALAEPFPTAQLELSRSAAASSCLDAVALTRSVEKRLRRRVFARDGALVLRVALDRRGADWVAELSLGDAVGPLGERSLSTGASHCSALDDSLALVVALLVDTPPQRPVQAADQRAPAERAVEAAAGKPAENSAEPSPLPRASTPLVLPADTWAPREPWHFAVRAGGSLQLGALPGLAYGAGLGVSARVPHGPWLRLNGDFLAPKESHTGDGSRGVRLASQRMGLLVCGRAAHWGSIDWEICAGQRVGRITAQGLGFDQSLSVNRLYWAAVAGAELAFPLTRYLYVPVGLFLEIPVTRDSFVAREVAGSLHELGVISGLATIAIEFRGGS